MYKSKWIILLVIVVVIFLAFIGLRYFNYGSSANAYTPPERGQADVEIEAFDTAPRTETVDNPTVSEGVVVIDYSHRNALFVDELNILLSKVVARGLSYEIVLPAEADSDNGDNGDSGGTLVDKLRYADALILPLPRAEYTAEEIDEIERFVKKGGRILIIGDPTPHGDC